MVGRRLFAISDLHVRYPRNRELLQRQSARPEDGLIVAGDIGEREDDLAWTFELLRRKFHSLFWVPGNHELWSLSGESARGEDKYLRMVDVCRSLGVTTPEDAAPVWEGSGKPHAIALVSALYDYTFAPDEIAGDRARALAWAEEAGLRCADEEHVDPHPFDSMTSRCHASCDRFEERLAGLPRELPSVLVNHHPLLREHAVLPRIPRFSIWCGTRRTETWVERARARIVVFGHLHIPSTIWRRGVRFEEVSLGYPKQWLADRAPDTFLREILPGPPAAEPDGFRSRRRA